jgi:hypothetical protein
LCKNQYEDAVNMAWDFLYFTNNKIPEKFTGDAQDAAELTSKVFRLARDPAAVEDPLEIPGGAFLPTGGVVTFDPADATPEIPIVAATTNGEAAVVIDNPDAFPPGTGMVTIALSRELDDEVELPGEFIPGFQAYPEGYRILSSHEPSLTGGGVLIALCELLPSPETRVIGWLHEGNVELLVPTDPNPEALGYIDCTDAGPYAGIEGLAVGQGLIDFARRLAHPVMRLLEPKPLNAMYFKGRGLGGRTTSLSLGAPVDPIIDVGESVQLSVGTTATWTSDDIGVATVDVTTGLVTGVSPGTAVITAEFGEESWSAVIAVLQPPLAPGMIDFDFAPDGSPVTSGTLVNDLYASEGVNFEHGGVASLCGTSVYANDWVFAGLPAPSLPNRVSICPEGIASDISENTFGFITAAFGPFVSEVCLDVSTTAGNSAFLAAYSQSGALLERATTPVGPTAATQRLCVTRPDPDMVAVAFSGDGSLFASFDNFDFIAGPGGSNQIAFVGPPDIMLMNANGTVERNVTSSATENYRGPTWSPDGQRIAFYKLNGSGIYVINADGTGLAGPFGPTGAFWPAWSPLGDEIAFADAGNIYVMDVDGTNVRVVTQGNHPAWSPLGTQIAYTQTNDIYTISSDGVGVPFNVTNGGLNRGPAWSPDGTQLAYTSTDVLDNDDIWVINADGSGSPVNVTNSPATENQVDWSPDGSMLTFWSNRAGLNQVFIQAADGSETAIQLTFGGVNYDPVWRPSP